MLSRGWQYMASSRTLPSRPAQALIRSLLEQNRDFSMGQKLPVSVVLRYEDGRYAIDADKSFDPTNGSNVLADYVRDARAAIRSLMNRG